MRGLDPRIHLLEKMDCRVHRRAKRRRSYRTATGERSDGVLRTAMPGNDAGGQAALIWERKVSISLRSISASLRRPAEADSTSAADVPASDEAWLTPTMLEDTSEVPDAACWMLRAISRVAAPCSSTAA